VDVKKLDTLPGMPGGFAFAMVLLGLAMAIAASTLGGIREYFFQQFGTGFLTTGVQLIQWGAVLQGVLWIVSAFGRKSQPPPAA